jgi:hypothetical protein
MICLIGILNALETGERVLYGVLLIVHLLGEESHEHLIADARTEEIAWMLATEARACRPEEASNLVFAVLEPLSELLSVLLIGVAKPCYREVVDQYLSG